MSYGCPDISGTYNNSGLNVGADNFAYLYDELTKEGIYGTHECEICPVNIRWLDDQNQTLVVSIESDRGYFSKHLNQATGDFRCDNGALTIEYTIVAEEILVGTWYTGTRIFKHRKDGSIVRKDQLSAFGHWLIIPFFLKEVVEYARWLPVEKVTTDSTESLDND
jgi:hypothetical protein